MSGRAVTLGFSVGGPHDGTMARMKRAAPVPRISGLIVLDDPDSLEGVVLRFHQAAALTLISQNSDIVISGKVRGLLPRYFASSSTTSRNWRRSWRK